MDDAPLVGWDPTDPANIADLRAFIAAHWDGLWSDAPSTVDFLNQHGVQTLFRNRLPSVFHAVYAPYFQVFERVYSHRLLSSENTDAYLNLIDLMESDVEVRNQFKNFILTGELQSEISVDTAVFLEHVLLVLDAGSGVHGVTVDSAELDGDGVISKGLKIESVEGVVLSDACPSLDDVDPAAMSACVCRLQWLVRASPLACMYRGGLWEGDPYDWGDPVPTVDACRGGAFDCDDFTDAMIRWLKARDFHLCATVSPVSNLEFFRLPILWRCGDGKEIHGHWVPVVIIDGKRYLIDPYTGKVFGPFGESEVERERMKKCGYETVRGGPEGCTEQSGPYVPIEIDPFWITPRDGGPPTTNEKYRVLEPRPLWFKCAESKRRFCDRLGQCCRTPSTLAVPRCPQPPGSGVTDDEIRMRSCSIIEDFHTTFGECDFPCPDCQTLQPPVH